MMKRCLILFIALAFIAGNINAAPTSPARNKDGSIVTAVLEAAFDPSGGVSPFPNNLAFATSKDLTIDITVPDAGNNADPLVAVNSLDGFSPVENWTTGFLDTFGQPGMIDPASVIPGQSVRVIQVTTPAPFVNYVVSGVVRELTPGVDFTAAAVTDSIIAIIPLKPLPEYSVFMAVLTNDIRDINGNNATPSQTYHLSKATSPWIDENGNSTYPLLPDSLARSLEPLRQITNSMEFAAASMGINPADIILSWTVQTQSISPSLRALQSIAQPAPSIIVSTGADTSAIGAPGLADIYMGVITLPYYLGVPTDQNPVAQLTDFWKAEPGAYIPPFDQFGLDPTSTNITVANPFPVLTDMQTVPLVLTVPGPKSGLVKPENGWPVVIFQHGLTRNRTDVLAIADGLASVGYAVISIDQPLHGAVPDVEPPTALFYIEGTPFAPIANERTFDADLVNNATGAPGPDGIMDASGTHSFNLLNLQTARDNIKQAEADLSVLAATIPTMSIDGDATPDLDGSNIAVVVHSLGGIVTTPFLAVNPAISRAFIASSAGSIMRTVTAGVYGDRINAALAAAKIVEGTAEYELFITAAQTVLDSGDPIHYSAEASAKMPILFHEVIGDDTVVNFQPFRPLVGSEPTIALMGLTSFSSTIANPAGLSVVSRFLPPAVHSSLLDISIAPSSTLEMQGQMASFIASYGTFVQVNNPSVMVPVAVPAEDDDPENSDDSSAGSDDG
jgi:pimeloyl-ACP methyl ester carboxylesterase